MTLKLMRSTLNQIRQLSTTSLLFNNKPRNHYDSLGLIKTATQAEVKSAYYDLSKLYHPDRNQGETQEQRDQHSQKFRDITEAYEVLGNVKSRRLYDKGFLGETTHTSTTTPADPLENFYKSRAVRTKPPTGSTAQPIYNFDEWSRQHYGQTARKVQEMKRRKAFYAEEHRRNEEALWQGKTAGFIMFVMVLFVLIQQMLLPNDRPKSIPGSKN